MQKISKLILGLMIGVLALSTFVLLHPKKSSETAPSDAVLFPINSSTYSIFSEVKNDGLASYLQITLPSNFSDLKITQTVGSVSQVLNTDEAGKTSFGSNLTSGNNTTYPLYFTRSAIYTVEYNTPGQNETKKKNTETYKFAPEINIDKLQSLYTTPTIDSTEKNNIIFSDTQYFLTTAGYLTLPSNSKNLYTYSFERVKSNPSDETEDKTIMPMPAKPNTYSVAKENIGGTSLGVYGDVILKISNGNESVELTQKITILTCDFDIKFYNLEVEETEFNQDNYRIDDKYLFVFNEGIKYTISLKTADSYDLWGNRLTENEVAEIFNIVEFNLFETVGTNENTFDSNAKKHHSKLASPKNATLLQHSIQAVDNSIYNIEANIKNVSYGSTYNTTLPRFKIMTKIPVNKNGELIISAVLGQVDENGTNQYFKEVLGGYLPAGSVIYSPASVRLHNNLYESKQSNGTKENFNTLTYNGSKIQKAEIDINSESMQVYGSSVLGVNENFTLENYFSFTFKTQYPKTETINDKSITYSLSNLLNNNISYISSGVKHSIEVKSDYYKKLETPINQLEIKIPSDYTNGYLPTKIRVTHNNTSFDNIFTLDNSTTLKLTEYGDYILEFYVTPSYNFVKQNYNTSITYTYKLYFTIAGPSISVTSTDNHKNPLSVSNNSYVQNPVSIDVRMEAGQQSILYLNETEVKRHSENYSYTDLIDTGTWKIVVIDSAGNIIKTQSFTLVDTIYQGFSINKQPEFESFKVSIQTSKMPAVYEELPTEDAYHLTNSGTYKIDITAKESFLFSVNDSPVSVHTTNTNSFNIDIQKSYFALSFTTGKNGDRITENIEIANVGGVQLQSLEVYVDNTLVKTFTADQLANWEAVLSKSFSDNGTYTFKITDKYGNTYEAQIEKYYKVNVALILLIILAIGGVVLLVFTIIKSRRKIKVK